MGKRSNFDRIPKDFYPTFDVRAMTPGFRRMIKCHTYAEPCVGEGDLVKLIGDTASCEWASDIEDRSPDYPILDAMELTEEHLEMCDLIITNPPYKRNILLPMLDHFLTLRDTWLLLPADLMHNKYFSPYMEKCDMVLSIGRMQWMRDSTASSTDNYCWYMFSKEPQEETIFIGRDQ